MSQTPLLNRFFQALATAPSEQALRSRFMDGVSTYFGVQRWGIYLLDPQQSLLSYDVEGVSSTFVERYNQMGKSVDHVLAYVQKYHAPAHEQMIFPAGGWQQSELYQHCCAEYEHTHIMTGPIVGQGQMIGTIHFARVGPTPAFSPHDLSNLGAVCTHLSACLTLLRQQTPLLEHTNLGSLTPRELQIIQLVAQGLTNAQIGQELWITQNSVKQALKRIFRKLNVSSRTEMVFKTRDILSTSSSS